MRIPALLLAFTLLIAEPLHLTLQSVDTETMTATTQSPELHPGVTGVVIRHFDAGHSAIVASALVSGYQDGIAQMHLSPYTNLTQDALPQGTWEARPGDSVIFAADYRRALLLAPTRTLWFAITSKMSDVTWIHPDLLAAFLSRRGHPTPLAEDLHDFCDIAASGLLYIYLDGSLFTLDCASLGLLQVTPTPFVQEGNATLPFYSRIDEIDASWFGEGSDRLESYAPYYLEMMVDNNPGERRLYDFIQSHDSADRQLLDEFDTESFHD